MELKIIKEKNKCSDHLIKSIPNDAWAELKRLAQINGLTVGKMLEVLITSIEAD